VWLYYHWVTKDTFYRVLNDYVVPKVEHEERSLGALVRGGGGSLSPTQRKEISEREYFVEELRSFRDEIARIASLWNPDPNDGVIINFAPLWRLVPQHRAWQDECRVHWEKLVAGEYDWARLAMHLWAERVLPKCAEDRSLAIAHGLEDVFWVEGAGGTWRKRRVDEGAIKRLVAERTSPAVKDALKSLVEAPGSGGRRGGDRRMAAPRRGTSARRSEREVSASSAVGGAETEALARVRKAIATAANGAGKSEVLAATGITEPQWNAAIHSLVSQGLVRKTGERRGARYQIVETEDRS
jgi:hypothetical protein